MSEQHLPKLVLPIRGMTCRSCEMLLEASIGAVPGVRRVRVNHRRGIAEVVPSDVPLNEAALEQAVEQAGYRVGHEHLPWISRDRNTYVHLAIALVVIGIAALAILMTGASLPSFAAGGTLTLPLALLIGLTAGFSTCMAVIGGIVLASSARFAERNPDLSGWQKFQPHLVFNAGRILGFAVFGGLLGAIGGILQLSDAFVALLTVAVGVVMLLLGVKLTKVSPRIARMSPAIPRFLQWRGKGPATGPVLAAGTSGALSFFLPCGFTLAMQLAAVQSGSFRTGALLMAAFALGTAPGLLSLGGLTAAIRGRAAQGFFATAGLVVFLLGAYNVRAGWNVLGSAGGPSAGTVVTDTTIDPAAPLETITMSQGDDGYTPNMLTVHAGSRVRWVINSTNPYTCASALRVPQLGIKQQLTPGENVIEFVATSTGEIPFQCSMGMYRGTLTVLPKTT